MQVAHAFEEPRIDGPVLLTIGTFDGVHRGHRFLLEQARQRAREHGLSLVIVTFEPSPALVLRPGLRRYQLTSAARKLRLLRAMEPACILQLPFTLALSRWSAGQFMDALEARLDLRELWLGEDFHFGHDREGGLGMLVERGRQSGFSLHVVARRMEDAAGISSSRIRQALAAGEVADLLPVLGYPFTLDLDAPGKHETEGSLHLLPGQVAESLAIPADGAYATLLSEAGDEPHPAACLVRDGAAFPVTVVSMREPSGTFQVEFLARLGESSIQSGGLDALFEQAASIASTWVRPVYLPAGRY